MIDQLTAIIKPTHDCNLACRYCYVDESAEQGSMSLYTLENLTKQLLSLEEKKRITFLWHGGEPLLMGLEFFREAISFQQRFQNDKIINNSIQTNGTLIDEEVIDFLECNEFSLGSSLDGPKDLHDVNRIYPDGSGSFDDVWAGLQKVWNRNKELRNRTSKGGKPVHLGGGVIVILNKNNIDNVDTIYDFFKLQNLSVKVNPLIKFGRAAKNLNDLSIGPHEYGKALIKLFDRWYYEDEVGIDVDPLSDIIGDIITESSNSCSFSTTCQDSFISIGPIGDVYPCGRFDGNRNFFLGNINEISLNEILSRRAKMPFSKNRSNNIEDCLSCEYKKYCNSGCMHNAFMVRGNPYDKDYYCSSYKILFKHIIEAISDELSFAKSEYGGV